MDKSVSSRSDDLVKSWDSWRGLWRYALAVGAVGLAVVARLALSGVLGNGVAFVTFFPAVAVVGMVAGGRAGLLATVLSAAAADWMGMAPQRSFWVSSPADMVSLGLFVLAGALMSVTAEMLARARKREWQSTEWEKAADEIRRSEAAVRERAEELAAVMDSMPAFTFITQDREGRRMTSSRAACELLRVPYGANTSKGAPVGERPEGFRVFKDRRELAPEELPVQQAAATGHEVRDFEMRLAFEDGTWRDICGNAVPLLDSRGQPRGAVGAFLDVTEPRRLERELRESEQKFKALFDNAKDVILILDLEGRFIDVNPEACERLGYSREELLKMGPQDIDSPEYAGRVSERLAELRRQGHIVFESEHQRRDGARISVEINSTLLEVGGKTLILSTCRDITARKRAEEELRQSEARFRAAFEQGAIPMALTATDGTMLSVNPAFCRMLGYTEAELEERTFLDITHPEDRGANRAGLERMVRGEHSTFRMEKRYFRKDGRIVWADMSTALVRDFQGRPLRLVTHVQDITARKQAEANQALLTDVLRILNRGGDLHLLIGEVLHLIRDATGFDAVGLRLRQGEDCPYFEQIGFSEPFLKEDNFLCSKGADAKIVRDAEGRAVLECTCGLVLAGRVAPKLSCFTKNGSFWTNASSEMLTLAPEVDPRDHPRNRCIHSGYQSVGLFPVSGGRENIGLLQLNDCRKGRFTPESIAFYESLAQNIGLALQRATAEEAVRRAEVRLAQAVRVAGLGTFEHDHRSDVIEHSPVMRELMGFGETEVITIPAVLRRVVPEDRGELATAIQQAHEPGGNGLFEVEFRVADRDGRLRWISARSQTFFEGEGSERRPVRTIGAARDVTGCKETQAALERLVEERTAQLRKTVGDLEHFSYSITHDMRAPLRAMRSFSSLLLSKFSSALPPMGQDFLQRIATAADRMDQLIADSLDYSKAVRQELTVTPLDPEALLRGMIESYPAFQPPQAQIQIVGRLPLVLANQAGLTQCFSNLLNNAVKFVQPGQKPHIRIWAETVHSPESAGSSPRFEITTPSLQRLNTPPPFVRIWIEDNGIGIPPDCQERIFGMFQRLNQDYEGTGIGLALVRKVVERMGGKVGVQSGPGQGSRFWLDLMSRSKGGAQ